jgi:hypothetical protein
VLDAGEDRSALAKVNLIGMRESQRSDDLYVFYNLLNGINGLVRKMTPSACHLRLPVIVAFSGPG